MSKVTAADFTLVDPNPSLIHFTSSIMNHKSQSLRNHEFAGFLVPHTHVLSIVYQQHMAYCICLWAPSSSRARTGPLLIRVCLCTFDMFFVRHSMLARRVCRGPVGFGMLGCWDVGWKGRVGE
jgi:hypothetical protein